MKNFDKFKLPAKYIVIVAGLTLWLSSQQLSAQGRKPSGNKPAVNKPAANKPAPSKTTAKKPPVNKPGANSVADNKKPGTNNSGNKTNNIGSNNNKVNIDNSKKNVNVNIDNSKNVRVNNSRNTSVRRNSRPYARPPYVYGGRRYRCYNPYIFHPYRPFIWGPMWHPWGFFVATLATTAIILVVQNDMPQHFDMASNAIIPNGNYPFFEKHLQVGPFIEFSPGSQEYGNGYAMNISLEISDEYFGDEYYYDQGVFYIKGDGGYTVVAAPLGAKIKTLPTGYETVSIDEKTKNYYYGGAFYEKGANGYTVVSPTAGSVIEHVSEGGEEVKMGEVTYIKLGETYFQPIQQNGKDMYEVVDVEEDK